VPGRFVAVTGTPVEANRPGRGPTVGRVFTPATAHRPAATRLFRGGGLAPILSRIGREDPAMGEVINLRLHRKRKDRAARDPMAAENRAKFGRTRAEKELDRTVTDLETRRLDGHRLSGDESEPTRPK
jgi:hypothetical protein